MLFHCSVDQQDSLHKSNSREDIKDTVFASLDWPSVIPIFFMYNTVGTSHHTNL